MPWCIANIATLWDTSQPLATGTSQPSNVNVNLPAGWTLAGLVSQFNDLDQGAGYQWTLNNGCLCVDGPDVELAIPGIKWENGGDTFSTEFAEITKDQADKLATLDACLQTVLGCTFTEAWNLAAANNTTKVRTAHAEGFVGGTNPANGQKYNATATKLGTGSYRIAFGTPHPVDAAYPVTFGPLSDGDDRDGVHIEVVNGTQTLTGFDVWVGTGDNGGAPDTLVDRTFSFRVGGIETDVLTAP